MFSDTQLAIYNDSSAFIFERLEILFDRSKHTEGALKALLFLTKVTMGYDRSSTEYIAKCFYPTELKIKSFFSKLNDFLYSQDSQHRFISSICDKRIMSGDQTEDKLRAEFALRLAKDLQLWVEQKFGGKTVAQEQELNKFFTQYRRNLSKHGDNDVTKQMSALV